MDVIEHVPARDVQLIEPDGATYALGPVDGVDVIDRLGLHLEPWQRDVITRAFIRVLRVS